MDSTAVFEEQAKAFEYRRQRNEAQEALVLMSAQRALAGRRIGEMQAVIDGLNHQIEILKSQIPKDNPTSQEGT